MLSDVMLSNVRLSDVLLSDVILSVEAPMTVLEQGTLTEGEGSVQLTPSFRNLLL
jgi:hypothetical protein